MDSASLYITLLSSFVLIILILKIILRSYGKKNHQKSYQKNENIEIHKKYRLYLSDRNSNVELQLKIAPDELIRKLDFKLFDPNTSELEVEINQDFGNRSDEIRFSVEQSSMQAYKDSFRISQPEWGGCIGAPRNFKLEELLEKILDHDSAEHVYYGEWIVKDSELVKNAILGVLDFAAKGYDFEIRFYIQKEELLHLNLIEEIKSDVEKFTSDRIFFHYEFTK